jgi:hypothetical protein
VNGRQAARAAAAHIQELEHLAKMNKLDIIDYNKVIDSMIAGGSPCEWCEDFQECQLEAKGKGCADWMLRWQPAEAMNDES